MATQQLHPSIASSGPRREFCSGCEGLSSCNSLSYRTSLRSNTVNLPSEVYWAFLASVEPMRAVGLKTRRFCQLSVGLETMDLEIADLIGGGGWTRTNDLRIMRPVTPVASKEDKALNSAESGKVRQNPQPPRNQNPGLPACNKSSIDEDNQ